MVIKKKKGTKSQMSFFGEHTSWLASGSLAHAPLLNNTHLQSYSGSSQKLVVGLVSDFFDQLSGG